MGRYLVSVALCILVVMFSGCCSSDTPDIVDVHVKKVHGTAYVECDEGMWKLGQPGYCSGVTDEGDLFIMKTLLLNSTKPKKLYLCENHGVCKVEPILEVESKRIIVYQQVSPEGIEMSVWLGEYVRVSLLLVLGLLFVWLGYRMGRIV